MTLPADSAAPEGSRDLARPAADPALGRRLKAYRASPFSRR
jgi:hypothetical protein